MCWEVFKVHSNSVTDQVEGRLLKEAVLCKKFAVFLDENYHEPDFHEESLFLDILCYVWNLILCSKFTVLQSHSSIVIYICTKICRHNR